MTHEHGGLDIRPTNWPAPLDDAERVRALALAHLEDLDRMIRGGAAPEALLRSLADAMAHLGRVAGFEARVSRSGR